MKLKHATLLVLAAAILHLSLTVYNDVALMRKEDVILSEDFYTSAVSWILYQLALIVFFAVLYNKQK